MMKIEKLNFSVRTYNILKRANINDVEQLKQLSDDELLQIRNLGRHSFEEIKEKLECHTITNADHIRSMSDEELAKALYGMQKEVCRHIAAAVVFPPDELDFADEAPDIVDWLKQPYKENTDG